MYGIQLKGTNLFICGERDNSPTYSVKKNPAVVKFREKQEAIDWISNYLDFNAETMEIVELYTITEHLNTVQEAINSGRFYEENESLALLVLDIYNKLNHPPVARSTDE